MEHSHTVGDCRFLFIGGEAELVEDLQKIFVNAGATIFKANDASEALDQLRNIRPSAVVLDYNRSASARQRLIHRLVALDIPFLFWSKNDLSRYAAWPEVPVVSKGEGHELLRSLLHLLDSHNSDRGAERAD